MLSKNLISFGKGLTNEFVKHIDSTQNVCIYKLGSHYIPNNIFFPNAKSITLINCNTNGILNIVNPKIFPNISKVNYLSADPGDFKIYERYNDKLTWVFPNKSHEFYDFMVKTGRGTKDSDLIKRYVANKKIINGKSGFDISFQFDLNVPEFGIIDGEWWRRQFYEYLINKQHLKNSEHCVYPGEKIQLQDYEEMLLQKEYVSSSLDQLHFDYIIEDDE